jgi:hypothetical protein
MKKAIVLILALSFSAHAEKIINIAGGSNDASKSTVKSSASTRCREEQLSVRKIPDSEDAAMGGHRSVDYSFTNISSSPCTLTGYPRVELLNKAGRRVRRGLAVNSERLPGDTEKHLPQPVTLEAGKAAWFRLYYNAGGAGRVGKPCPIYPKVRITAPGTSRGSTLREQIQSCQTVEVSAVQSGSPQ